MRKAVTITENKAACRLRQWIGISKMSNPTGRLTKISSTSKSAFHFANLFSSNS